MQTDELVFTLTVSSATIGYLGYYFLSQAEALMDRLSAGAAEPAVRKVVFQRLTGVVLMGILPPAAVLAFTPLGVPDLGLGLTNTGPTLLWTVGLSALVALINFFNARKPSNLAMYPQIRIQAWTKPVLAASGITWALYLLAYEVLFRGVLFLPLVAVIGLIPAVVLNASIYALAHLPKGMKESLGAIPFGVIICLITYSTGNIWTAFLVHTAMALSNEWLSLYFHPEMKLQ